MLALFCFNLFVSSYVPSIVAVVSIIIRQHKIIIIVEEHHLFMMLATFVSLILLTFHLNILPLVLLTVFLQFLELICICSTDELAVHVKDLSLWVHQELTVVTFNLDSTHDHVVLHVHGYLFVSLGRTLNLSSNLLILIGSLDVIRISIIKFVLVVVILVVLIIVFDIHIVILMIYSLTIDWHSVVCSTCSWMALPLLFQRGKLFAVVLVWEIFLDWRATGSSYILIVIFAIGRSILEVHWVMCLVVQESLALKEVLASLKGALLLHLLEAILVVLQYLRSCVLRHLLVSVNILVFEIW